MAVPYLTSLFRIVPLFYYAIHALAYPTGRSTSDATYVNIAYLQNSVVYQDGFSLDNYNFTGITHVLYAFGNVNANNGSISLSDPYADTQIILDGQTSGSGKLNGLLGALFAKKLDYPYLKVILSIGGASGSEGFAALADPSLRTNFVNSAIDVLENYGLDGIDIDWETPSAGAQAAAFTELLSAIRDALTQHASSKGDSVPYQLSIAAPAGTGNIEGLQVSQVDALLDYWNLMAYDYSGSWSSLTCPQDNVYGSQCSGVSTDSAISTYLKMKATPGKITLGVPIYGRSFTNTNGPDQSFNGVGADGGTVPFSQLPPSDAQVTEDTDDIFSYSYSSSSRELISFDTSNIVKLKAKYVQSTKLGGLMYWDLSQDKSGSDSLVNIGGEALGSLNQTLNHVSYPTSQYSNIRQNAGRSSPIPTPTPSASASASTESSTTMNSNNFLVKSSKSGQCAGVVAWSSSAIFNAGDETSYNGHLYTAKWCTTDSFPSMSGAWGPWADNGAC